VVEQVYQNTCFSYSKFCIFTITKKTSIMKKLAVILMMILLLSSLNVWTQCVFACYTYSAVPTTFSVFPSNGPDVITSFSPTIDDGITSAIPIGFNFTYYCSTYSTVLICSNGFIQFDIGSPPNLAFSNPAQSFPDPTSPNGIVALNMTDFDPNVGGSITYTTVGTAPNRMFVVTYSNVPMWSCSTIVNTGQIVLFETSNNIEIHTGSVIDPNNLSLTPCYPGTQGIENPSGSAGISIAGRNVAYWVATTPSAYRFNPIATYTPAPQTNAPTGSLSFCEGTISTYSIIPNPAALSYNWSLPFGWSGTSTLSSITTTAGASGNLSVSTVFSCGVSAPTTLSVTTISLPFVSITSATPAIFCSGITVTINTSGAASYTLQPGNLTGTPPFYDTPLANTIYTVTGVNSSGCESKNLSTFNITVKETPTISIANPTLCLGETIVLSPAGANTYTYYTPALSPFPQVTPVSAGTHTYLVIGTSTNGCVSDGKQVIANVFALPTISVAASRSSICTKESTSLTVSGAVNYSWSTNSNNPVIVVTPLVINAYTVVGIDANGCVNTGTYSVKVNNCTALRELETSLDFQLYPNPSNGLYTLQSEVRSQIVVLDILGQKVFEVEHLPGKQIIDLKNFKNGSYFLSFISENGTKNTVLLKE